MFCPLIKEECKGKECTHWVVLSGVSKEGKVNNEGRCSAAWIPTLLIELKLAIEKKSTVIDK